MFRSKEKVVDAVIDGDEKTYFLPRLIAYILDILIVFLISGCIMFFIPENKNYDKYVEEYKVIQNDFITKKIDTKEYINKSVDVVYDVDYNNIPSMIIELVVLILYFVVYQFYNKGQTIGKKLMKIKVVSTDSNDLNINQLAIRSLIINSIFVNLLIVGFLLFIIKDYYYYASMGLQLIQAVVTVVTLFMILIRKDGKGLHDVLTSTKVVNV